MLPWAKVFAKIYSVRLWDFARGFAVLLPLQFWLKNIIKREMDGLVVFLIVASRSD